MRWGSVAAVLARQHHGYVCLEAWGMLDLLFPLVVLMKVACWSYAAAA